MSRNRTITQKVNTNFGSMYFHIEYDNKGFAVGGWISDPGKEPNSQISTLVEILSNGLNEALKPQATEGWFNFNGRDKKKAHFLENGVAICGKVHSYGDKSPASNEDEKCGSCLMLLNE